MEPRKPKKVNKPLGDDELFGDSGDIFSDIPSKPKDKKKKKSATTAPAKDDIFADQSAAGKLIFFFLICFTLVNLLNIVVDAHSQINACCLINAYSTILSFLRRHSLINAPCLLAPPMAITPEFLEKAKRSKNIHVIYFLRNLSPETALRSKPNVEESLRGSKLVNNLEIVLKNDQTIIEFGFCMMWRIIQMEENIWGGKQPLKSV